MAHFLHLSKGKFINLDHVVAVEEMRQVPDLGETKRWESRFVRPHYVFDEGPIILRVSYPEPRYDASPFVILNEEDAKYFRAYFDEFRSH